jgi:polyhydroxybutyrate depolymerase
MQYAGLRVLQVILPLLLVGLTIQCGTGQEAPPPEPIVQQIGPGDQTRTVSVDGQKRTYRFHVPQGYDPKKPTPVVLALHGAGMNGSMMVWFSGLNEKSEEAGFIVVYPSGTGIGPFCTWNAGNFGGKRADDVAFIDKLLDDLGALVNVDQKRVYACGMSNGGMMCYRLAAELSERIAAIAPVAGTVAIDESRPTRPVPVIHFHGTEDNLVPFESGKRKKSSHAKFEDVEGSIRTWVKLNGCEAEPKTDTLSEDGDETPVTRKIYGGGKDGAEVVLIMIEGGGHTWPGQQPPVSFIGRSAKNISANDLMWKFLQKHPMR